METYLELIENKIKTILNRPEKNDLTFDLLDTDKSMKNKMVILKEKQKSMKIGEIWQEVIGNYEGFTNLKIGHVSGLDIISVSKKVIIELKNRTNTDNHSSKKTNFDKLAKFKKENPEYLCIYMQQLTQIIKRKQSRELLLKLFIIMKKYINIRDINFSNLYLKII